MLENYDKSPQAGSQSSRATMAVADYNVRGTGTNLAVGSAQASDSLIAGRYQLDRRVGSGGAGVVWRAEDSLLRRAVAMKELKPPLTIDAWDRERIQAEVLREARAAARLHHEGAVTVYDVVQDGERQFIVMELIDAPNLSQVVKAGGPLPPAEAARIGTQLLDVLETAHRSGIIHRDVKPGNVMVPQTGGRVLLGDFGIASLVDDPRVTATGLIKGTPSYMAPEQAMAGSTSPATDLWSLGATLYFAAEGRPPFDKGQAMATLAAIAIEDPRPVSRAGPLAGVLTALLDKDPNKRPDHATLRQMLSAVAATATPPAGEALMPSANPRSATTDLAATQAAPYPFTMPSAPVAPAAPGAPAAQASRTGAGGAGDRGTDVAGDRGTDVAGDRGAGVAGDRGTDVAGDRGAGVAGTVARVWPVTVARVWPVTVARVWPATVARVWPVTVARVWPATRARTCPPPPAPMPPPAAPILLAVGGPNRPGAEPPTRQRRPSRNAGPPPSCRRRAGCVPPAGPRVARPRPGPSPPPWASPRRSRPAAPRSCPGRPRRPIGPWLRRPPKPDPPLVRVRRQVRRRFPPMATQVPMQRRSEHPRPVGRRTRIRTPDSRSRIRPAGACSDMGPSPTFGTPAPTPISGSTTSPLRPRRLMGPGTRWSGDLPRPTPAISDSASPARHSTGFLPRCGSTPTWPAACVCTPSTWE